jgi:hypothetical protein
MESPVSSLFEQYSISTKTLPAIEILDRYLLGKKVSDTELEKAKQDALEFAEPIEQLKSDLTKLLQ